MESSPYGFGVLELEYPFMRVKRIDTNAIMPHRAHSTDAGLDVFNCENVAILAHSDNIIRTGIAMEIPNGWVAVVKEKSGRATKNKLTVGACVIDSSYRGELLIHLFNNSDIPVTFNIGEKIAQLVIVPCWTGDPVEVDDLEDTERGEGRMGSTGINENKTCSAITHEGMIGGLQGGSTSMANSALKSLSAKDVKRVINQPINIAKKATGSEIKENICDDHPPTTLKDLAELSRYTKEKMDELGMRGELEPNSWEDDWIKNECTCHERDDSYRCEACHKRGEYGHMESRPEPDSWDEHQEKMKKQLGW